MVSREFYRCLSLGDNDETCKNPSRLHAFNSIIKALLCPETIGSDRRDAMQIPGYQLGRKVGIDRFSTVYNALHIKNSKTVTIQLFNSELTANKTFRDQFRAVTDQLSEHSFGIISPIISASITDQHCYQISEYFPSQEHSSDEPAELNVKQILKIGLSIASSLSQLHAKLSFAKVADKK